MKNHHFSWKNPMKSPLFMEKSHEITTFQGEITPKIPKKSESTAVTAPRSGSEPSLSDSAATSPQPDTVASCRRGRRPQAVLPGPKASDRSSLRSLGRGGPKERGPAKNRWEIYGTYMVYMYGIYYIYIYICVIYIYVYIYINDYNL